ncbi:filamentous hemagglutinin N-terminal domain-containing protein [Nostoc flagelliforme FACHB-838]|uniref:Filamentous hemagglutinin N-terminal domain-containing protein n=1 Tax=Nostoc flagelliforme FACHB-838 TaxID=2692904 RepID=A0ABR8E330_9NOSO|nr:filamentous hemagglutinin N-terminal domain-containing protein [Nostoc flagelliforme]MBD2534975.1 filamentous hemagglutinin N-terminal domain-containing protein [Nostoc flagelliforme FACHB-838]
MSSWRFTYCRSLLSIAIAGASVLPGSYALAQIIPDASIGNTSNVTQISNDLSVIGGGTQVGNSLFHSFSQLSVPTGNTAYFNNPLGIENIFTRVTGNNISNIDGLIRTNGTANLFLVNPNGIVFGSNARLDVGGSFAATTASGLKFADGNGFNAINPQTPPLSIISTQGLQYRVSQPGATITAIGNLEVGQDLTFVADKIDLQGELQVGGVLRISAQDTVRISNSVAAPSVNIEAGSLIVRDSSNLNHASSDQGVLVPVSNGATITVDSSNLVINNSASISVNQNHVNSTGSGGNIYLNAGNISISTSEILIAIKPVPEPTLPFSMFAMVTFYAAWRLKGKHKQTHKLKA